MAKKQYQNPGTFAGAWEIQVQRPLDDRCVVDTQSALTTLATWVGKDGNYYHYKGMMVSCADTGKVFTYIGASGSKTDVVNSNMWVASDSGGTVKDVTVNGTSVLSNGTAKVVVPTKTSELTNDSNLVEDDSYVHTDNNYDDSAAAEVAKVEGKVDKVAGKGLSTNDYTTEEKKKLAAFGDASEYALKSQIANVYKYKGSVATISDLPSTGNTSGDVYNVEERGINYAWTGTEWDALGELFSIESIDTETINALS